MDNLVQYPIKGLKIKEQLYDLYAVANHYGDGYCGHYMAKVKDPVDKNWYEYNDSNVIEINEDKIVDKHAYILFYRQQDKV